MYLSKYSDNHYYMKALFALIVLFFCSISIFSQKITVYEETSDYPLAGVAIYNKAKNITTVTDINGEADISAFKDGELIFFQHISHQTISHTKKEIVTFHLKVYLPINTNALEEVVLSASKFGQHKKDIAQKIVSISSKDIIFSNPQTAADLLESTGQVYVQKSQLGGGSPMIRGFATNRLLIAVDGIRFNTAIFRGGNVQNIISIDPFTVEHTEVILGPGSIIYGSDAIGGVINFYTKKPKLSNSEKTELSGSMVGRFSSANLEKTGHLDINFGKKQWAFMSSISFSDFDDLTMGKNGPKDYLRTQYVIPNIGNDQVVTNPNPRKQIYTGYSQLNLMQKIRYIPNENWDFNLGLFYTTTSDIPRYDRLIRKKDGDFISAEWYYGPQKWVSGNLQVAHSGKNWYDKGLLTLSYQRFNESRNDRNFGEAILYKSNEEVNAYTTALDFTKKIHHNKLFYGFEYVYNKVNSEGSKTNVITHDSQPDASRYPDNSSWQSMAVYTNFLWRFSEKATFQTGVRYNHVILQANLNTPFYDFPFSEADINTGALTGSAGLSWQPSKTLGWKVNFSTAFRAPNIDDVGKIFDSEPGAVVVPNPNLKPEYAYNGEVGLLLNFEEKVKLNFTTYLTHLKDALVRRNFSLDGQTIIDYQGEPSTVQAIQNLGSASIQGFELGFDILLTKNLNFTGQYSVADGLQKEENGEKVPVRHVAPAFANAHLIWKKDKLKLDAFVNYNGTHDFEDMAPSEIAKPFLYLKDKDGNPYSPSWYTLNITGQYQLSKALQFTASLENITNQLYRPYASGIAAPGTNLIGSLRYSF